MHIPDYMLKGKICPVTAGLSLSGLACCTYLLKKIRPNFSNSLFASVAALIFTMQLLNFPVANGTSGHLLGSIIAVSLLGVPGAVLAMALVITIQALVFSDGGLTVLGANIFNMAIVATGLAGLIYRTLNKKSSNNVLSSSIAAFIAVLLSAFLVTVELSLSGRISFSVVFYSMMQVHFFVAIVEALVTGICVYLLANKSVFAKKRKVSNYIALSSIISIFMLLPFASNLPDGLEYISEKYQLINQKMPAFRGLLNGYHITFLGNSLFSTILAGLVGVSLIYIVASVTHKVFFLKKDLLYNKQN